MHYKVWNVSGLNAASSNQDNFPWSTYQSMDIISEFSPPSKEGYHYILTIICMLTGFVVYVPIKSKSADKVVTVYTNHMYIFGPSHKILSDNGTELKNKLFEKVASKLATEYKTYSLLYRPQSNDKIEGFHECLKSCISKHISPQVEWSQVVHLACVAYNWLPNEILGESSFFLMFVHDPMTSFKNLIEPTPRYLGDDKGKLSLQALQNIYQIIAQTWNSPEKDGQVIKTLSLTMTSCVAILY